MQEVLAVFGGDAAHDESQADDSQGGHDAHDVLVDLLLAEEMVEKEAQRDGADGDDKNGFEHANCVNVHLLPGQIKNQKRGQQGGKQRAGGGHADGKGHVALAQEGHKVRGDAAGAAADQNKAYGKGGAEAEGLGDRESNQRH